MARALHPGSPVRRFGSDERGNFAVLFAAVLALGTVVCAFAVDEGALYLQRRQAQSAVDLAAIAAAADLPEAFSRAREALAEAGLIDGSTSDAALTDGRSQVMLTVDTGTYAADSALAVAARFQPGGPSPNAVRIRFHTRGTLYFAQSWMAPPDIGVEAVASGTPIVMFSVGSTLAQLQDGIPNAVLSALLGANVTLSAASYNGLLNARVGVFTFLDALAQRLNIGAGTYSQVLAASADRGTIAEAIAMSLNGADAQALDTVAQALQGNGGVPIGKLLNLGDAARLDIGTGARSGAFASVSALSLLAASGAVSDGTHQVALNLGAGVPGLTSLTLQLAVGEPKQFAAWFSLGPSGAIARTAQVRLQFIATIGGTIGLSPVSIRVPLLVEVAPAEAGVQSAACPAGDMALGSAVIAARPGIARLTLGEVGGPALADFSSDPTIDPATLINLLLLKVTGSGEAGIEQASPTALAFSAADISQGAIRQASTTTVTQSLATSLLSSVSLHVTALGVGLPSASSIRSTVSGLISPLGPPLDAAIAATLGALGLELGVADVEVYGVSCGRAVLVE